MAAFLKCQRIVRTTGRVLPHLALLGIVGFGVFGFGPHFSAAAQEPITEHYTDLWTRGEYRAALKAIEELIAGSEGFVAVRLSRHHAQLLFETGQVDKAIAVMEEIADKYPEPANSLDLALMYQYAGRKEQFETKLGHAARQTQGNLWRYSRRDENLVAMGRIAELVGEQPKTILNTHYGVLTERNPNMVIAYIAAGDLAWRKAGYDVAATNYQKALELEPDNQDALAGLAETYWKSNDERLEETMNKLLALNPHHPRAKAIEVELLLDKGNGKDALSLIEDALEINPVSLRFRSLQAAAYFLEDDEDAMRRVQTEVLQFNPVCSEVYRTTGRIASRQYRFKEGAAFQKEAITLDPQDHEARALYTQDLMRMGDETTGRAELEQAFAADPFNVHLFNLLELMDTLATFEVIERGPFVLKLPKHEAPLVAEDALDLLDQAITQFTAKYEATLETPILIEMFDRHDDFMVRSVGLPGSAGHLGICFGKLVTMDSPSARPRGSWNWRSVLWHEFMHVITLQKTNNRMPRWLSEGISVHEEGQYSPAWKSRLDPSHRALIAEEGVPTVRDLDGLFTDIKSADHLMFGYFAAGEFVDFYIAEYGTGAMNTALDAIGKGTDAEDALTEAAGLSLRDLDAKFAEYMGTRLKPFENLPPLESGPNAAASALTNFFRPNDPQVQAPPSPYTDLIKQGEAAESTEDWAEAEKAYIEAHALFPDDSRADAPLRRLAALYARREDHEKLRETLETILYWTPAELSAAKELIEMYRQAETWTDVARVADWAVGVDPYDIDLQRALLEGQRKLDNIDEAIDSLGVLAHLDTGRAVEYRLDRATLLAGRGDWEPAKRQVLLVLEEAPNFWDAQELLLRIVNESGGESAVPTAGLLQDETAS